MAAPRLSTMALQNLFQPDEDVVANFVKQFNENKDFNAIIHRKSEEIAQIILRCTRTGGPDYDWRISLDDTYRFFDLLMKMEEGVPLAAFLINQIWGRLLEVEFNIWDIKSNDLRDKLPELLVKYRDHLPSLLRAGLSPAVVSSDPYYYLREKLVASYILAMAHTVQFFRKFDKEIDKLFIKQLEGIMKTTQDLFDAEYRPVEFPLLDFSNQTKEYIMNILVSDLSLAEKIERLNFFDIHFDNAILLTNPSREIVSEINKQNVSKMDEEDYQKLITILSEIELPAEKLARLKETYADHPEVQEYFTKNPALLDPANWQWVKYVNEVIRNHLYDSSYWKKLNNTNIILSSKETKGEEKSEEKSGVSEVWKDKLLSEIIILRKSLNPLTTLESQRFFSEPSPIDKIVQELDELQIKLSSQSIIAEEIRNEFELLKTKLASISPLLQMPISSRSGPARPSS